MTTAKLGFGIAIVILSLLIDAGLYYLAGVHSPIAYVLVGVATTILALTLEEY